jgi:hypothetical protein|tara:strand:+ start:541 stop:888 length:348 start_codon:yes stop_codon:yes gene_type:complete
MIMHTNERLLNHDSDEVTKEDYKAFYQAFNGFKNGLPEADSVDEMQMHNFYSTLLMNRDKFKNDPLSMEYIKNHSKQGWGYKGNPNYDQQMQTDYAEDANEMRGKENSYWGRNWK